MKCDKCGYSDNGTGDWAHACGPVAIQQKPVANTRIHELAEQATVYHNGGLGTEIESFDKEKFAQLIVQECASRLVDMDQQVKGQHNYYKHASIQVLLHFGIQP